MFSTECENEKCKKEYYAERSTSRFCQSTCRTAQHKSDKKRANTLAELQSAFPESIEHIDSLNDYNLKNRFLDMVAAHKTKTATPDILEIIWAIRQAVTWQKNNKIDHLKVEIERLKAELNEKQTQIDSSIEFRKTIRSMCQSSLADDGVPSWQM